MGNRSREMVRLELMLEDASIKLSTGGLIAAKTVSARAIMAAMIDGETDARVLAEIAPGRIQTQDPRSGPGAGGPLQRQPRPAGEGGTSISYDRVDQFLAHRQLDHADSRQAWEPVGATRSSCWRQSRASDPRVAQTIVAEDPDADMAQFPPTGRASAARLGRPWRHTMPESAGKRTPAGRRRGNKWLTAMLVEAAGSVGRMRGKNYLAAQHARLTRRRGISQAQIAVAHSILTTAYYMLKRDEPYRDLGPEWLAQVSSNDEAHTRRLVAQLEKLGRPFPTDTIA